MARIYNTSASSFFLEELISYAKDQLILVSPTLVLTAPLRRAIGEKNRQKLDIRLICAFNQLTAEEMAWLSGLNYVRVSTLKGLRARCYMSESACILSALDLHEVSQPDSNDLGLFVRRTIDADLYDKLHDEMLRIVQMSDELVIEHRPDAASPSPKASAALPEPAAEKLSTSALAKLLGIERGALLRQLIRHGLLQFKRDEHYLTAKGKQAGGEVRIGVNAGSRFYWPPSLSLEADSGDSGQ